MSDIEREIFTNVVVRDGRVLMLFSYKDDGGELIAAKTDNLNLDPPAALIAAELLTSMAFEADTGLKPVGDTLKASLVEKHREKLIPRIALMLASMRQDKTKTDGAIALQIVDAMCSEVFS